MKIVKWLRPLIDHLWESRSQILKNKISNFGYVDDNGNYRGIPKKISDELSSHNITIIRDNIRYWHEYSDCKKEFTEQVLENLSNGLITY